MGTPNVYKKEYCQIAIDVLSSGESLAAVCAELNIARSTLYEWRDSNPEFKAALEQGLQKAQRDWERLGRDGINGNLEKFSQAAYIFTMKNRFRADYAEDKEDKDNTAASVLEKILKGEIKVKSE